MSSDVVVSNGIVIPEHELEITTSRGGGPGGQHVNKTDTRVTVRWNIKSTQVLTEQQKLHVLARLHNKLTSEGDILISNCSSRSQLHNKEQALAQLAALITKALYVPKKRKATRTPKGAVESRLYQKTHRGALKKMRGKKHYDE